MCVCIYIIYIYNNVCALIRLAVLLRFSFFRIEDGDVCVHAAAASPTPTFKPAVSHLSKPKYLRPSSLFVHRWSSEDPFGRFESSRFELHSRPWDEDEEEEAMEDIHGKVGPHYIHIRI